MPFDSLPDTSPAAALARFREAPTPRERLAALPAILRDRSTWPRDFVWNFNQCQTCAMGLSALLMKRTLEAGMAMDSHGKRTALPHWAIEAFALSGYPEMVGIFGGDLSTRLRLDNRSITPEHVAQAIERHLAAP